MRFIFSLIIIIFLSSTNINATETNTFKFDNEQLNEFIKKNKLNNKFVKKEKEFDISKFKGLIPVILVIIYLLFFREFKGFVEEEGRIKKNKSKDKNQSKIDEFVKESNKKHKDKEREDEFSYDEENYEDEMQQKANKDFLSELYYGDLKIKIEEKIIENELYHAVLAIGNITSNFNDDIFKSIKKENDQVKFTIYVFDVTDKEKETVLQCLTDPFKDENNFLSSTRNMEVKVGYSYEEWTTMFLFPKSIVVPPYRGERKIKFVVSATKINSKFEQGKTVRKKDLYLSIETILKLNFQEPGYLEEDQYEEEVNEKIVQLGLAVAYSEKKINQRGVEAIKTWINTNIIWKNYFDGNIEKENENKIKYSFLLNNTYELLKNKKLSLSEIVKELNYKSNASKRYDAMNLLLNVAGSDDHLSAEEDKLLNKTARALELDIDRFQQMKTSTIANIDTIDDNNEANEDTIFNFSSDMTNEEKCKKLRQEFTRWNRLTNTSNEKIRNQAKKMVELTANLRKKYNC